MNITPVWDASFAPFGRVVTGYDTAPLLRALRETTPKPNRGTVYVASDAALEALPIFTQLADGCYGGMPIQIGYCNGTNRALNCLEYHRGSELNIPDNDVVLLVAPMQAIAENELDTSVVQAFLAPAGTAVLLYETTLHYAPCDAPGSDGFRVVIVLPRGTNTEKPDIFVRNEEDQLLYARNKWLLARPDAPETENGAVAGLTGPYPFAE